MLFVSGSEAGKRVAQHRNVVDAAKAAGVGLLVYTSTPQADTTDMILAGEHLATEQAARRRPACRYVILRNSWYIENYNVEQRPASTACSAPPATAGSAAPPGPTSPRRAAAVLVAEGHDGRVYELGGEALHA